MAGLAAAFGSGAMTNTIACIEKADVILITGSNTTENHPVLSSFVKRAVTQKGTKLIVVDPRRITITRYANKWLRQNLGTDVAYGGNRDAAQVIGRVLAERALSAGIKSVKLDRGHCKYHGRVAALTDAAREAGLEL